MPTLRSIESYHVIILKGKKVRTITKVFPHMSLPFTIPLIVLSSILLFIDMIRHWPLSSMILSVYTYAHGNGSINI